MSEICKCRCHEPGGENIMWDAPHFCCLECNACGQKIVDKKFDEHYEACISHQICKCICHEPGKTVIHFMACCHECQECGKNIKTSAWNEHKQHCLTQEEAKVAARIQVRQEFEDSHEVQKIQRIG